MILKKLFFVSLIFFTTLLKADPKMELGLKVYNEKAMCGTCHVLNATKSEGQIGPNLDQLKPQIQKIIYTVTNGVGVMPAYEGVLSFEEIEAVAYFVFNSTNQ